MKPTNALLPTALLAFALAACQQQSDGNIAIDETNTANAEIETLPPDETVAPNGESNVSLNEADDAGSEQPSPPGTPGEYGTSGRSGRRSRPVSFWIMAAS